ncbi:MULTISPECIES: hypothetical protein [Sporosarcina]|uniref:hypothetical protein n=1 Tax=Sporosarcina TaxID=1569 RepID=UPI00129A2287|nr:MULTISPECIES: hypothetical protein [Sporosarcina]GKV65773.1 hypothetical protein NCCP2331_19260 [Sporosarcina sp. NCCP-2331]GLB55897.1 hypothetical protein NCCP2378_16840 [Sporosarcina sp. NCCP-2378]
MQKKIFFLLLTLLLATGCAASKSSMSNTPEEALDQLHAEEGFAEVIKVYRTLEVDNDRVITVYKGNMDQKEEIFIANVKKSEKDSWSVTDAISIGVPSEEITTESTATASFEAGYIKKNSAANPNTKTVEIDDDKYKVWVKVNK